MTLSVPRVRHYLQQCELEKLFIEELGWDRHSGQLAVQVDGQTHALRAFAEKRGVQIFICQSDAEGKIPEYAMRRKIEKQVTRSAYEHLIIFVDAARTTQIWQWVARQPGQPASCCEHSYYPHNQSGDALIQKLQTITIPLNEEDAIDLTGAVHKLRDAFDRDRVTKRFYERFKQEHAAFLSFIKGITEQGDREWYASLMLNRMMFVYFIQRKGFLDSDPDYLKNRLRIVQQREGKGKFLSFYRYFLLCLFHEGLSRQPAQRDLSPDLVALLGDVPYLNGGLFELHELEQKHQAIDIPDEAFEKLFAFFDQYEWHLDTRPLSKGNEINPEVLGYIFEKYINQKQMGAYYTKEDITEYIGKNTVIPYLFDTAEKQCAIAFRPDAALWRLLKDDPDRYFYPAMHKGVIDDSGEVIPLTQDIARGIDDVSQRDGWNRSAAAEYALPTETWREHVARRQRYLELRDKLQAGAVHQINDLITYNLDIRQFAEDVIAACEGPELLRAFYHAISTVTVLDPTCGSGAFLFAALNILEPLYEACLDRMQAFVDDLERTGERHSPRRFADFRRTLAEAEKHPNRIYFILKSIIVNNLYGVDIMEEAVEICKLRLFLKLVAQVDKVKDLEPLPDIDFNIRPGNTLIGFATLDDVQRTLDGKLGFGKAQVDRIVEEATDIEGLFQLFRQMQTIHGMDAQEFTTAKQELRKRLRKLAAELDQYLASEYGVEPTQMKTYDQWRERHQPFHWFAEFYGNMSCGGFNIIIGNPPYLEKSKLGNCYSVKVLHTLPCRDIYSWFVERSLALRNRIGRLGFIIPVSMASSRSFDVLRNVISSQSTLLWMSHFANRPGQLFVGAQNRLTILLSTQQGPDKQVFSTRYHRWDGRHGGRDFLFYTLRYVPLGNLSRSFHGLYPKTGSPDAIAVLHKIATSPTIGSFAMKNSQYAVYWVRVPGYFCQFFLEPPKARPEKGGAARIRGEVNAIYMRDPISMRIAHAFLNSSTYYQFFTVYTDGRHINPSDVIDCPFDLNRIAKPIKESLVVLSKKLEDAMVANTSLWRKSGLLIESVDSRLIKPVIDEIDGILDEHYGFAHEELDFIVNYDIKYRMGQDDTGDDE